MKCLQQLESERERKRTRTRDGKVDAKVNWRWRQIKPFLLGFCALVSRLNFCSAVLPANKFKLK